MSQPTHIMSTQYGVSPAHISVTTSPKHSIMSVVELVPVVSLVSVPVTVVGSVVTELLVESEVLVEVVSVVVVGSVALGSEVVLTVPPVLVPSRTRHISSWTEAGA